MPVEIVMPRLGWQMEEGTLVEWCKANGDRVAAGEIVCIVEGDKALHEVESFGSGILAIPPGSPAPGVKVPVGTVLGWLLRPGEAPPAPRAGAEQPGASPVRAAPLATGAQPPAGVDAGAPTGLGRRQAPAISPRARRLATELGVGWTGLRGTGHGGRIRERDVRAAAAVPPAGTAVPAGPGATAAAAIRTLPVDPIRRRVAERMAASAHAVAPVTLTTEVDATRLVRLRSQIGVERVTAGGPAPSLTDCLVKLAAAGLVEHPALNASLAGEAVVRHAHVHVGLAVDTERGLLVPVLRDVPRCSLSQLAERSAALLDAARRGRLAADDLRGATFTVSNLGMYDVDAFTPIVSLPECAILGVGRVVARPVVVDEDTGAIAVRKMMTLSLTFDHRVVDGAPAARFLQQLRRSIERPEPRHLGYPEASA